MHEANILQFLVGRQARRICDQGYVNGTSGGDSGAASPPPNILFWVLLAASPPATPRKQRLRRSRKEVDDALHR
jgi:hypothetical protein